MTKRYTIATNAKRKKVSKLLKKIGYEKTLENKGSIPQCGYSLHSKTYWELIMIKDFKWYCKKTKTIIESEDFHLFDNTSLANIPSKKKNCYDQLKKDFLRIEEKLQQQGYQTKLYGFNTNKK